MLCSHRHKFIFLKTHRTAGTSVELFFEPFCLDKPRPPQKYSSGTIGSAGIVGARGGQWQTTPEFYNHMPASEIRAKLGAAIFDSYLKFCTVRNPFDKIVSYFWWDARKKPDFSQDTFTSVKLRFARYVFESINKFDDKAIIMINGQPALDAVIRYEHLADDTKRLSHRLQIEFDPTALGHHRSGARKRQEHFSEYYDPPTKRLVERIFSWELATFGYDSSGRLKL